MCETSGSRGKGGAKSSKPIGVLGLVTAAGFGIWLVHAMPSNSTGASAPAVQAQAEAAEPVATGSGFPVGTVVVAVLVTAAVAFVTWMVVGKFRDMLEDRRADERRRVDQVQQMTARHQTEQQQIEPRKWRYTLTERIDNELVTLGSQVFEYPATSKREVAQEVQRRAVAKRPGNYNVKVELVSK